MLCAYLAFVNSLVAFRDVSYLQPKSVWELQIHQIPQISDECVGADCQKLQLLTLLWCIIQVKVEDATNPRYLHVMETCTVEHNSAASKAQFTVLSCNKFILQFKKAVLPSCMVTLINDSMAASSKWVPKLYNKLEYKFKFIDCLTIERWEPRFCCVIIRAGARDVGVGYSGFPGTP